MKLVDFKVAVVTKKTVTSEVKISPHNLLLIVAKTIEQETGITPHLTDIQFDSDIGRVDEVQVKIKLVQEETL